MIETGPDIDDSIVTELAAETAAQLRLMRREREAKLADDTTYFQHAKVVLGFVSCYVKLRDTRLAERQLMQVAREFHTDAKERRALKS